MSGEENKANVRRVFEEGWNQGNTAVFDELFAADYLGQPRDWFTGRGDVSAFAVAAGQFTGQKGSNSTTLPIALPSPIPI